MTFIQITPPHGRFVCKWVFFFLYSLILLAWLSPDSFLMTLWSPRDDSAWFFTCGKAWMEGMTPYVDFADSKGPLLWLIYGLGYLLSPDTYAGVFWLSVLAYTFTFAIIWRTSRLFSGRRGSAVALLLMSVLLFFRQLHDEVRAEDFCMPWICAGLYCTIRALQSPTDAMLRRYAFVLGVSLSWGLLIKWNLFFMMGGMALLVLGIALRKRRVDAVLSGLSGLILPLVPFVAYFMVKGNWNDMIQEYFVNTFLITDQGSGTRMWMAALVSNCTHLPTTIKTMVLCTIFVGMAMFCRRRHFSWWLLLTFLPFFLFLELKAPWRYYTATAVPFFVFPLVLLAERLSIVFNKMPRWAFCAVWLVCNLVGIAVNVHYLRLAILAGDCPATLVAVEQILAQRPRCKIMYTGHDFGWGLRCRALPACKYWALQNAASSAMRNERKQAIRERKPDFVLGNATSPDEHHLLLANGYRQCQIYGVGKRIEEKTLLPLYVRE